MDKNLGGFWAITREEIGFFADFAFAPFLVNCEVAKELDSSFIYGKAALMYIFDLDALKLGVGAGMDFSNTGWTDYFAEAAANFAVSDNFAIYGSVSYWWDGGYTAYQVGASLAF